MIAATADRHQIANDRPVTLDPAVVQRRAAELVARDGWTRQQLLAHQQGRLREVLRHAVRTSPYYRETIGHLVARRAPLEEVPVLTKSQLVANFDRIVSDRRLRFADIERHLAGERAADLLFGQYRACATGGTTGVRALMVYDQTAWTNAQANAFRSLRAIGGTAQTRVIGIGAASPQHLSGRIFAEMRASRPDVPRLDVTMKLTEVVGTLNEFQPELIITYPSFIRRLAEEQLEGRLSISTVRFFSVAEALMPDVRDLARQAWGATIYDRYSSTETGISGSECAQGCGIHLPEDLVVYEAVDEANHVVAAGKPGSRLLITTLTNAVLPLIRYEHTDIVTLAEDPCACGRPYARIVAIEGRREEVLRLPRRGGGRVDVHAFRLLSPLIKMPGIRQYQLLFGADGLTIKVAVRDGESRDGIQAAVERSIRGALMEFDAAETAVAVEIVQTIERSGTGSKIKLVERSVSAPVPGIASAGGRR